LNCGTFTDEQILFFYYPVLSGDQFLSLMRLDFRGVSAYPGFTGKRIPAPLLLSKEPEPRKYIKRINR